MDASKSNPNPAPARLELLSAPGCRSCQHAHWRLQTWLAERPSLPVTLERVDILDDLDRAVDLGVLRTPALVLDGRLIAQGAPLDMARISTAVQSSLDRGERSHADR